MINWERFTVSLVLAAAAAYLLYRLRFVLLTVSLAAVMAYALLPTVEWATHKRVAGRTVSRLAATTAVFLLGVVLLAAGVLVSAGPVAGQLRHLALQAYQYQGRLARTSSEVLGSLKRGVPVEVQRTLDDVIARASALIVDSLGRIVRATTEWLAHVVELLLVPILAFYFLVDLPILKRELLLFLPARIRPPVVRAACRLDRILAAYVRAQLILIAIAATVTWIGLALLGMRSALVLGLIAGIMRAIPIAGSALAAIPIVGLALAQSAPLGAEVLVFFVALQVVESKLIVPLVVGRPLRLHAATVLLALLIGNALFGLVGIFLAAPVAAALRAGVTDDAAPAQDQPGPAGGLSGVRNP